MYSLSNKKGNKTHPLCLSLHRSVLEARNRMIKNIPKTSVRARSLKLTEQLVIFGVQNNFVSNRILDLVILMAKYHIFRCRYLKDVSNCTRFSKEVKQRATVKSIMWLMKGNVTMIFPVVHILSTNQ